MLPNDTETALAAVNLVFVTKSETSLVTPKISENNYSTAAYPL